MAVENFHQSIHTKIVEKSLGDLIRETYYNVLILQGFLLQVFHLPAIQIAAFI